MIEDVPVGNIKLHPDRPYRQELGNLTKLLKSMERKNGLLHPICVDTSGFLVYGRRRFEGAKKLKWKTIPARIIDLDDPLQAIEDENECREEPTPSEKVAIGKAIEAREKEKAKDRQKSAGGSKKPSETLKKSASENFSQALPATESGRATDKAAEAVGMSRPTYEKAKEVVEAAKEDPSLAPVVEEMDRTNNVSAAHRKVTEKPKNDIKDGEALLGKLIRWLDAHGMYETCRMQLTFIKQIINRK